MLKQTPLVMHLVGADFLELRAHPHFFDGMFPGAKKSNPKHHAHKEMNKKVLGQIPEALTNPITIFKGDRREGSFVFMLDVRDSSGNTVVVPVQFEAHGNIGTINLVKTAFGKNNANWFLLQGKNNAVRYVSREKIKHWFPTSGSNSLFDSSALSAELRKLSNSDGTTVLTDADLVKLREEMGNKLYSGPRGTYMPQNTSDTNAMSGVMTLMQTRDKSTFLHESAHVWLDADTMLPKGIADIVFARQDLNQLRDQKGVRH